MVLHFGFVTKSVDNTEMFQMLLSSAGIVSCFSHCPTTELSEGAQEAGRGQLGQLTPNLPKGDSTLYNNCA